MKASYSKSSLWLLLLLFFSSWATAQDRPTLETVLARLPPLSASSEITAPAAMETEIKKAFIQQDEALEEALSLLYQIFSKEAENPAEPSSSLKKITADVWETLADASQADSLQLARLKNDFAKINQTGASGEGVTFAQAQAQIGGLTAQYLMQYFYANPTATKSMVWQNYLQGKAIAPSNTALNQAADKSDKKWQQLQNWIYILLGLSLVLLAGLIYLFFTKIGKKQYGTGPDFHKKDFEKSILPLENRIQEVSAQQKALEEQLKAQSKATKTVTVKEKTKVVQAAPDVVSPLIEEESVPTKRTYYSVAPKNGVFFLRQLLDDFKTREHIYRIEVLDEERAYYYLVEDTATRQHAFNIPDSYILPAMELEGTGRLAEASQVDVQRGTLKKAGNNWQIEEKAVLNYSI